MWTGTLQGGFLPVRGGYSVIDYAIDYDLSRLFWPVILSVLKLHLCCFNGCSFIQFKKLIGYEKK